MPVISKLLIAGRGEIALRIMRTARELDIATVAVFSDPDTDAPFVAAADEAVHLPGAAPAQTYLRGEAIIAAARATGAQAIHPGYGFLSENADFARACAQAGLIFVGPTPEAIEAMGSKIRAKELMAAAGVPVLPGAAIPMSMDVASMPADGHESHIHAERRRVAGAAAAGGAGTGAGSLARAPAGNGKPVPVQGASGRGGSPYATIATVPRCAATCWPASQWSSPRCPGSPGALPSMT